MDDGGNRQLALGLEGRDEYRISNGVVDVSRPGAAPRAVELKALPQSLRFDLSKSALVIVDMQNDFCSEGGFVASRGASLDHAKALFQPINRVIAAARARDMPVVWLNWGIRPDRANLPAGTQYTFSDRKTTGFLGVELPPSGPKDAPHRVLVKGEWGAAIVDALDTQPQDIYIDKHRISGFWDTELDSVLKSHQVSTLFFAGVNSDHCVLATLMDANFKGYDTILIEDCAATTSPEFCHRATLHNVRFCFGFTTTSEDISAGLNLVAN